MIRHEVYIWRVEARNEEFSTHFKTHYRGDSVIHTSYRVKRPDKMPKRMRLVKLADGIKYSDYGGAILVVYRDVETEKVVKYGMSVCSMSDRFDIKRGERKAYDRMMEDKTFSNLSKYMTKDIERLLEKADFDRMFNLQLI